MIEAYEIGITLALDNGVSSGVAAIRQDLEALDRAVASSSAGLFALRSLSTSLSSVTPAHPDFRASLPQSMPAPSYGLTEFNVGPVGSLAPEKALPHHADFREPIQLAMSAPASTGPSRASAPPERPPAIQITAPITTSPSPPTGVVATPNIPEDLALASKSNAPIETERAPTSPAPFSSAVATPMPLPGTPLKSVYFEKAFSPRPAVSQTDHPPPAAPVAPPPPVLLMPQYSATPPAVYAAPTPVRPIAPLAPAHHQAQPSRPDASPYETASHSSPMTPSPHASSAAHGEIILDSVRLGRWMSDRLARAADRPQSGTTGFDPRVSHSHAGAPNGS